MGECWYLDSRSIFFIGLDIILCYILFFCFVIFSLEQALEVSICALGVDFIFIFYSIIIPILYGDWSGNYLLREERE